jgi:hypothetical protein
MYKAFGSSKEIAQLKDESLAIGWICKLFFILYYLKTQKLSKSGIKGD